MKLPNHFCSRATFPLILLVLLSSCGGGGGGGPTTNGGGGGPVPGSDGNNPNNGLTATLTVESSDQVGDQLTYEWKVTAGTLSSSSTPSVQWTVPSGGGLHFAYLTVSDGKGGYVERQYALELGTPTGPSVISNGRLSMYSAPTTPEIVGGIYRGTVALERSFAVPGTGIRVSRKIPLPDFDVGIAEFPTSQLSPSFLGTTDLRGEVTFPKLVSDTYRTQCAPQGLPFNDCLGDFSGPFGEVTVNSGNVWDPSLKPRFEQNTFLLHGHVNLLDGSLCGLSNKYKQIEATAVASLIGPDGSVIGTPVRVNAYGDYAIGTIGSFIEFDSKLRVTCGSLEQEFTIPNLPAPLPEPFEFSVTLNNRPPFVSQIQARVDGLPRGSAVVDDPTAPSSKNPRTDHFLTYKGTDTPQSSCAYYRSIGATPTCDPSGNMAEAIKFDEWKRIRKLAPYNGSNQELTALYLNRVDLNLVRDMHGVRNAADDFAFYVCNHPGPATESQADVDVAISTARAGRNRVACVAMDYSVTPGVNDNSPFTKFYVFGPDGSLLPSVNLDGRGEKFVPGSCVVCHGGDHYSGRFPTTTSFAPINGNANPSGNLGSKFLPFDIGNYAFSTETGLTRIDQELAIKRLNMLVRSTEPTESNTAIKKLIEGWYDGNTDPNQITTFNDGYIPDEWLTGAVRAASPEPATAPQFYQSVIAKSCRTCHVALPNFDWDSRVPFGEPFVCGGSSNIHLNGTMANSKVTFDQMWKLAQQPGQAGMDYRRLLNVHLQCRNALPEPLPDPAYPAR